MPAPTILFVGRARGAALMRRLGARPEPALAAVRADGALFDGYAVPAAQAELALRLAEAAHLPVHRPASAVALRDASALTPFEARLVGRAAGAFLDIAGTSMGRATFYNTRDEQERAEAAVHEALFRLCRPLYGLLALLPGTTDRTRAHAAKRLLCTPACDHRERAVVDALVGGLPPPRMLRLFGELRARRVNNARARKLILRALLDTPKLELWAVKYRRKVGRALEHALGRRRARMLAAILAKTPGDRTDREHREVRRHLLQFAADPAVAGECVRFVLGDESHLTRPLLAAYVGAKRDLAQGVGLPPEVLEGLRSTFHRAVPAARALELGRAAMSQGQRMAVQRRAERAGVRVAFDPRRQDAIKLYVYAYERGVTPEVAEALDEKARRAAARLPARYARVGLLVDGSRSMAGARTQPLRPMAAVLALRDMLAACAEQAVVRVAGGAVRGRLVRPEGDSSLAAGLLALLRDGVDAVFVLTDGYENAPAGRVAEVMARVRELGCDTPVYQLSPVFGAEASGVRRLAPDLVPALPVAKPDGVGLALLRAQLDVDPLPAVEALVRLAHARREVIR